MKPWVVLRARNDMPLVAQTLAMLARQTVEHELLVLDNASTDGSREEAARHTPHVHDVPAGAYVPGRVLNRAMRLAQGEVVAFLNSDCTPVDERWLERMLAGMADARVAAAFGRQAPRPDCRPLFARDTEATYGDGSRQRFWRHCFSMASSAVRRPVWEQMPFDETIQYSEDIEWTWRARRAGWLVRYVPDAVALHSHNYTLGQFYRRHRGEGRAEARIFEWTPWQRAWPRYSLMPFTRQVLGDWHYCLAGGHLAEAVRAPALRLAQMLGRRRGFAEGWRERLFDGKGPV